MKKMAIWMGIFSLMLIVFISGASAAACVNDNQIIFRLAGETNSHISEWNDANAPVKVCYDEKFQTYTGLNPHNCNPSVNPTNVVLRGFLSGALKNTHAERVGRATRGYNPICYGDLSCFYSATGICNPPSKPIVYLSGDTNAHVSKTFVEGWGAICCSGGGAPKKVCGDGTRDIPNDAGINEVCEPPNSACDSNNDGTNDGICSGDCKSCVATQQPVCGDGQITGTEECDPPSRANVGGRCEASKPHCGSNCKCSSEPPVVQDVKDITKAEWRDPDAVQGYEKLSKAKLTDTVVLYGEASGFTEGEGFDIEVYNVKRPGETVNTFSDVRLAPGGKIIKAKGSGNSPLNLKDVIKSSSAASGESFTFEIIHTDNEGNKIKKASDPITVDENKIVTFVDECSLINPSDYSSLTQNEIIKLCDRAEATSILKDPAKCVDGKRVAKCFWENNKCSNKVVLKEASGAIGTCTYNVNYQSNECKDGYRKATVTTSYSGAEVCREDCAPSSSNVGVPCGRSFLTLPFFAAWQIVGAVIVIFLVYLVLWKTGVFKKKDKLKRKR